MARKNILDTLDEVAKTAEVKGVLIELINVADEFLMDCPDNNEDVSYTKDLELSMKENGFIDPIDITDFGMEKGYYMKISGHRRVEAGKKVGYKTFPCILRHFDNKEQLDNFLLMSNSHRKSENDPLLYVKRYKDHENYLLNINFKGSFREEIADRLGVSIQQVDRYKQMQKVIMPMWDLVSNGYVGMTNILFMSNYSVEQQLEIYDMFMNQLQDEDKLNAEKCKMIKQLYDSRRNGDNIPNDFDKDINNSNDSIKLQGNQYENVIVDKTSISADIEKESVDQEENIYRVESDEHAAPFDRGGEKVENEKVNANDKKREQNDNSLVYYIKKVDATLDDYVIKDTNCATATIKHMNGLIIDLLYEIKKISDEHSLQEQCNGVYKDFENTLARIKEK